jgi:uncharacterized caspase-like protein
LNNGTIPLDNRKAIIIGINEYESYKDIPTLNGAENDAREIRDRFLNYGKFEVSDNHYLIGRQATRKNILRAVGEVFRKDSKYDLVTLYFSGHGIMDENDEGYLAPYDMDPEYPFVSGINMEDLKKVILNSNNKAGVIFILDCCYAGIATKDTKSLAPPEQKTRNLYSDHLQNIIKSSDTEVVGSDSDLSGKGKIVLASSEADEVSREKNNCIHSENDAPHSHGAFSYHLIEGLDGKAADSDNGIITIDNLRKYIEDQMKNENRQKIVYHISQASNIENIKIAVSQNKFEEKIKKLIAETDDILSSKKSSTAFSNVFDLQDAANKIKELIDLNREHKEIDRLQAIIDDELNLYKNPTIKWINSNIRFAQRKVNEIRNQLYEEELPDLVNRLCFSELFKIPNSYLNALVYVFAEVEKNTRFESLEDQNLKSFVSKLRVAFDNIENELRR